MWCRVVAGVVLLLVVGGPAEAQVVVLDPANLTQTILIAERTWQQYQELRREYELLQRMGRGLGSLQGYRVPPMAINRHDVSRWTAGRPWLQGLNSGDPAGTAYLETALPLLRAEHTPAGWSEAARQAFARRYATVEITDDIAIMGGQQVALARGYHDRLQEAVQALEADTVASRSAAHQLTALLDKVTIADLLARRQDMLTNQLLSHALEQLLARSKRARDTEAAALNMQLTRWRDGRAVDEAFVAGTGDALRTWRQP